MCFFPKSRASNYQYSLSMIKNFRPPWIKLFYVFFYKNIIVNHFLYFFIILTHWIYSIFYIVFVCSICICFYWMCWLYSFTDVSTQCILINFICKYIVSEYLLIFNINQFFLWNFYDFLLECYLYQTYFF